MCLHPELHGEPDVTLVLSKVFELCLAPCLDMYLLDLCCLLEVESFCHIHDSKLIELTVDCKSVLVGV